LGAIVGSFKSATTREINTWRGTSGQPVWQRGYYERVIGDETILASVRQYIANNPRNWSRSRKHGAAARSRPIAVHDDLPLCPRDPGPTG